MFEDFIKLFYKIKNKVVEDIGGDKKIFIYDILNPSKDKYTVFYKAIPRNSDTIEIDLTKSFSDKTDVIINFEIDNKNVEDIDKLCDSFHKNVKEIGIKSFTIQYKKKPI